MDRSRKTRQVLDAVFFVSPEQKLLRFLLSEPTTSFTPRVLSSKLKGVRGLGGAEGIKKIVEELSELGLVQSVDNNRKICLHNEHVAVRLMKTFAALCDLDDLRLALEPITDKGVLFGSRANGLASSDSDYNLFVVGDDQEEIERIAGQHPMGKKITVTVASPSKNVSLRDSNPDLFDAVEKGFVLWGNAW